MQSIITANLVQPLKFYQQSSELLRIKDCIPYYEQQEIEYDKSAIEYNKSAIEYNNQSEISLIIPKKEEFYKKFEIVTESDEQKSKNFLKRAMVYQDDKDLSYLFSSLLKNPDIEYYIGEKYYNGQWFVAEDPAQNKPIKDKAEALYWYIKSASKGFPDAEYKFKKMLKNNDVDAKQLKDRLENNSSWILNHKDQFSVALAMLYSIGGKNLPQDQAKAISLYEEVVNNPNKTDINALRIAKLKLSEIYKEQGKEDKSNDMYIGYLKIGNAEQKLEAAERLMRENNKEKALKLYKSSAEAGNKLAQYKVALYDLETRKSLDSVIGELIKAGSDEREYFSVNLNSNLDFIPEWKLPILKQEKYGLPEAQYLLGVIYYSQGELKKASNWFEQAAKQNHNDAKYCIIQVYEDSNKDITAPNLLEWRDQTRNMESKDCSNIESILNSLQTK